MIITTHSELAVHYDVHLLTCVELAVKARVGWSTEASVVILAVGHTCPSIHTHVFTAVVHLHLTQGPYNTCIATHIYIYIFRHVPHKCCVMCAA